MTTAFVVVFFCTQFVDVEKSASSYDAHLRHKNINNHRQHTTQVDSSLPHLFELEFVFIKYFKRKEI